MRRRIVLAIALCTVAAALWLVALQDRTRGSTSASSESSESTQLAIAPPPLVGAPAPTAPDAAVLDGPIIDLGYGFELTVPSFFRQEKVPGFPHSITFMDEGRRIRVAANAVPASRARRHDDPLDGARELARDQKTRITHYENTPDGAYVVFDGEVDHTAMRQHLVVRRTPTGRVSVWIILLDTGITHPDNLALVDELRTGGRLVAR